MNDFEIVELYFKRDENAITETRDKYGRYLESISYNILRDFGEAEECTSDAYMRTWEAIPPKRPILLGAFIGKIVRNISVNRYLFKRSEKRGGSLTDVVLDELSEIVSDSDTEVELDERIELRDALNSFLSALPYRTRVIFVRRYWYSMSISDIARVAELSENNVKVILSRSREKLKKHLKDKGVVI